MHFDDVLQEKIKKWDLITRKDLIVGWDDIVIYRSETEYWTHWIKIGTLYKRVSTFHICKYQYEEFWRWCRRPGKDSYEMFSKDGKKIEKLIIDNMEKLKWLWKLEMVWDGVTFDGTLTDLYFSDSKQWVFFTYSVDNDINWKNMKILLDIQIKVEKCLMLSIENWKKTFE